MTKLKNENEEIKQMYKNMTQGINEANKLYNEKMDEFNKEIYLKNNKVLEYKNKILVLKRKINEMYEEINTLRGNSSVNNTSFFSTSFINNSIINTNPNQKPYDKIINNMMALSRDSNTHSITKKLSGLSGHDSKTIDRNNLNDNFNKATKNIISNKKKIYFNQEIKSPHIKKEILFPQTPQIKKEILINSIKNNKVNSDIKKTKTIEYINKNKEQEKKNIDFLKEYKEILEKLTKTINNNLGVANNENK